MYTQVHAIVPTYIFSGNTNLKDPCLLKSLGPWHPIVTVPRTLLSARAHVGAQEGQCQSGLRREAQLTCHGLHCSRLVMDKTNPANVWDAVWLEGFVEEGGLKLGLKGEVHVSRK